MIFKKHNIKSYPNTVWNFFLNDTFTPRTLGESFTIDVIVLTSIQYKKKLTNVWLKDNCPSQFKYIIFLDHTNL